MDEQSNEIVKLIEMPHLCIHCSKPIEGEEWIGKCDGDVLIGRIHFQCESKYRAAGAFFDESGRNINYRKPVPTVPQGEKFWEAIASLEKEVGQVDERVELLQDFEEAQLEINLREKSIDFLRERVNSLEGQVKALTKSVGDLAENYFTRKRERVSENR